MMRRRILILAQVSPPSRRSECVIALFEIAGGIIQPEERIWQ